MGLLNVPVLQEQADLRVFAQTLKLDLNWLKGSFDLRVSGPSGFLPFGQNPSGLWVTLDI